MQTKWTIPTDKENIITVESSFNFIMWSQGRAYAGFEAEFEARTFLVGDGAKVKVTCRTQKGKKLDKVEGAVFRNRWRGSVVIPEKVKVDDYVYLEAELPKIKIDGESNLIPVRPSIEVVSIQWDKQVIHRDEEVKMTCIFTGGVEDGDRVTVKVLKYDSDGYHDPIVKIPTTVENGKVELKWKFMYQDDTNNIPIQGELEKYGKSYEPPKYFFVVLVDNLTVGKNQESGLLEFKDSIEIQLTDDDDDGCADIKGTCTLADGSSDDFTLDGDGKYSEEEIVPGKVVVSFEDVEKFEFPQNNEDDVSVIDGEATVASGDTYKFKLVPNILSE